MGLYGGDDNKTLYARQWNDDYKLDLIGRDILSNNNLHEKTSTIKLLDNILLENPVLLGFGLFNPQGEIIYYSSNLNASTMINLKENKNTRQSFAQTLVSDKMVLGQTYFNESLQEWVIPIRKALRDKSGTVIAVMTAGMAVSRGTKYLNILQSNRDDYIMLAREIDGFIQYSSVRDADIASYIKTQTKEALGLSGNALIEQTGKTKQTLKSSEEVFSIETTVKGKPYITSAKFDNRYQLWTLSQMAMQPIKNLYYWKVGLYVLVYVFICMVLFFGFRLIARAEKKRIDELFHLSRHDDLTKLPNRKALRDSFEEKKETSFSLAIINITNLRSMNNRFGMEFGDKAIKTFAGFLKTTFLSPYLVFRNSGNEFCIIAPHTFDEQNRRAFEHILESAIQQYETNNSERLLNISVGIACYPEHRITKSKLVRSAHLANQWAKDTGQWLCHYHADIKQAYLRRLKVEERLNMALNEQS